MRRPAAVPDLWLRPISSTYQTDTHSTAALRGAVFIFERGSMQQTFIPPSRRQTDCDTFHPCRTPSTSDRPEVDSGGLNEFHDVCNSRMVTALILIHGRYVIVEYLDDGDGPLLDKD